MDYNENDSFQSQNHHIAAGEGSNKFPPVLRPYALPKFDFDDSLQGHLRFDSLVESEVFLGIENNEDNRWIEDYSRGSCGIEFSKSRIDSCTVSRSNNVWSEATSSESVEMLLKSVGQEEVITTQSVAEVSDAFDELSCLTKSMEPDLKHDTIFSKIGDIEELQSAFTLDGVPENSSRLKDDYQGDQSQVEGSLQTDYGESSICKKMDNSDLSISDQCLLDDGQHMVVTGTDVSNLVDEVGKEKLTCSDVHMDDAICNTQNIISGTLKSQEDVAMVDDVSAVSEDGLQKDTALRRDKMNNVKLDLVNDGGDFENMIHQTLGREAYESTSHSVNPVILSSSTETTEEQNDSRPNVSAPMEASFFIIERSSDADTLEGCAEEACCGETSQDNQHKDNVSFEDASVSVPVEVTDVVTERSSDAEKLEGGADEACHEGISQASQHEDGVSFKNANVTGKLEENIYTGPDVVNEGNKETDSNIEEVCNVTVKQLVDNEQAADPPEEGTDERSGNLYGDQLGIENVVDKVCGGQSDSGTSLHSVVNKLSVNDGDGSKDCVSMELPMETKIVYSAFEGSKVEVSEMDGDSEIQAERSQQTVTGEKLEGSILNVCCSDSADVCKEQSKQLISCSSGPIVTDFPQTVTIERLEGNIMDPHSSDFADVCQEQSKQLFGFRSEDGRSVVTDSQPTIPMETLEENISDSRSSDAGGVCQEQSKQVISGFCGEDGGRVLPDECLATSTPNKLGSTEDLSNCTEVQKSVEVALGSTQSIKSDDGEASPRGDVATLNQNTDTPETVQHRHVHEPANGALSGNQELSLHGTTSDCLPKEEGDVDTESNDETHLAEAQVICQGPGSVDGNIHHVMEINAADVGAIVTSLKHKETILVDDNKLEFEVSDDVSKTPPRSSAPAPLSEGNTTADVLKNGSEQADVDETISASITVNEKSNHSISGNEDGVESLSAKDIGVSEVKVDPTIDNPQVSSPKDRNASKIEKSSAPQIVEASPLASGSVQSDHQAQQGIAIRGGSQASKESTKQKPKGTPERKASRASAKAAGRESSRKSKDSTLSRSSKSVRKPANLSISSPGIYQFVQSNEIIPYGQVDGSGAKSLGVLPTTPTARLPDLNSTAYPPLVFQQPFTDSQQVELRAQIFVYGSLISKQAPEESHMVSAFGGPDGGRSMWEKAWKVFKARTPSQPSPGLETPSRSGNMASDSAVKQKTLSASIVRSSPSGTPSSVVNSMIPLSSPLWNIPTPSQNAIQSSGVPRGSIVDFQQAFSQMGSQQTPPIISYVGPSNTTWLSQTPFRGPWSASAQAPALDTSVRFPSLLTETVQLTPIRESSLGLSTSMKHVTPVSSTQGGDRAGGLVVSSAAHDLKRAMGPSTQSSMTDRKVKRRRKVSTSEDHAKISSPTQMLSEKVSDPAKINLPSLSSPQLPSLLQTQLPLPPQSISKKGDVPVAAYTVSTHISATTPGNFVSKDTGMELNAALPPSVTIGPAKNVEQGPKKPILSEDAICNEKEARKQAEDAATLAIAAVSHSEEVWDKIYKKQNSGLMPATEAKLASAAVAIAAAAAVAKAASAAANVASNAALQAKLMADEALSVDSNTIHEELSSSSSIITAAKEAARRRVQAASAAALRADNLDAIVKAAELAAEAISQAGKVVAMGDPLTLRKLAEAGPDGFWKLDVVSSDQAKYGNTGKPKDDRAVSGSSVSIKSSDGTPGYQEAHATQQRLEHASQENFRNLREEELRLIVGISGSVTHSGKDTRGQQFEQSSLPAVSASVNLESLSGLGVKDIEMEKAEDPKIYYGIREGAIVEVFKDGDEYKGAWFLAKVMNLKDGKAHVCYSEISSTEGSGKLDEWINLTSKEGQAPKIRVPHPMTAMQYEGSKKRRRAAVGYLTCSVGDKVDAWIHDRWWEGVVTEKNKNDETSLTLSLPALEETLSVRAWNLRPSLIWRDGEWVEWSFARETGPSHRESDTPKEKRAKLGTPANEAKGKDKDSKAVEGKDKDFKAVENPNLKLGKHEESKPLDLSDKEKKFNIGTSIDKSKPDIHKPARPGMTRKGGAGAIFGVPKPGKKRKFMDVSKHYDGDQDKKAVDVKDSVKLANYMMPRGTGPRGMKSSNLDPKEKQGAELKSKGPKSVGTSGRGVPQRNNNSRSSESASEDSAIHVEAETGKNSRSGTRSLSSNSKGDSQGPFLFSSQAKKTFGAASKSETGIRGRSTPAAGKLTKIEENKVLDAVKQASSNPSEPARRSVRRIQPTSRLLEGLQSSLLISKIPSHDKSHRPTKTVPKGKNQ